ncbi:MAG: glycosyltransferase, partial [Lachnospiraceae bacterium]|nr:glycosyltransferase [Lachnospiraceae bacterium]
MKTLSVIIPNYNNEKYLRSCLDSVLGQTYPLEEIVIYDD